LKINFLKYQAAGNDFVLIDNRQLKLTLTPHQCQRICDRRFGVGADGIILVDNSSTADFHITYYNPDGTQSLCGNGCRTGVELAARLGLAKTCSTFSAFDGTHEAELLADGLIKIKMSDLNHIEVVYDGYYMDTGSPHFVRFVKNVDDYPVFDEGKKLRYDPVFPRGTNANFIEWVHDQTFRLRTYERGVEQETLACGTGATASALAAALRGYASPVTLIARGGELIVSFLREKDGTFRQIYLTGPARLVFEGQLEL
jgi:diaminopimelate epimerase